MAYPSGTLQKGNIIATPNNPTAAQTQAALNAGWSSVGGGGTATQSIPSGGVSYGVSSPQTNTVSNVTTLNGKTYNLSDPAQYKSYQDSLSQLQTPQQTQPYQQGIRIGSPGLQSSNFQTSNVPQISTPEQSAQAIGQKYQSLYQGGVPQKIDVSNPASAREGVQQALDNYTASQPAQQPVASPAFVQYGDQILQEYTQSALTALDNINNQAQVVNAMKVNMQSQINNMDLQAMNVQNMMDGTADSIRQEVSKAGGFATESQIQGIASVRNRELIKQYNTIQMQKAAMTNQMQAQVGLAQADLQYAQGKYDMATNAISMYQSLQTATDNKIKNIVSNVGYSGLANTLAGDPYSLALAEQHLGLPQGTLSDPNKLSFLETYRQQSLGLSNQRLNITLNNTSSNNDPEVLNGMVSYYKSTGNIPPFGMSNSSLRNEFWKAVGQEPGITSQAAATKASIAASTAALRNQQTQYAATRTSLQTFENQMKLVNEYSNKVDRSGTPLLNKYLLFAKGQIKGDADTAAFQNIVKTASLEFAKIMSGASASIAGVTVSSASDAENLINTRQTPSQIKEVMSVMKREADYRLNSYGETINQLQKDISNQQSGKTPSVNTVNVNGTDFEVGQVIYNSRGQKGRVESDGSITLIQ